MIMDFNYFSSAVLQINFAFGFNHPWPATVNNVLLVLAYKNPVFFALRQEFQDLFIQSLNYPMALLWF